MSIDNDDILEEWHSEVPTDFIKNGNCRGMEVSIFFPFRGESTRRAKEACNGRKQTDLMPGLDPCPVRDECLAYALSLPTNLSGVWGGVSQKERRRIKADQVARDKEEIIESPQRTWAFNDDTLAELVEKVRKVHSGED